MATVTAISTKGGGGGKATLEYICRDDKTDNKNMSQHSTVLCRQCIKNSKHP